MSDFELDGFGGNFNFRRKKDEGLSVAAWVVITIIGLALVGSVNKQMERDHEAKQNAASSRR